ncbi:hypothetical protein BGX30_007739 [Mortierella sp. GBA39]|nr:hypothetical protein BGX30_007739 [Mortierella sp. GBA39]
MLASRSPTFRRIFDEMILEDAWGESFDADISSEGGVSCGQLDEDDELVSYNSDYGYQDSVNMSGEDRGPESDNDESMRDDNSVSSWNQGQRRRRCFRRVRSVPEDPSALVNAFPRQLGPMDSARGNGVEKGDEDRADDEGAEALSDDGEDGKSISSVGTDGGLPELVVAFADPEGSHFKELLYWLYTGDGNRWVRFFTPENYGSILQNILHLNIVTREVLEICMAFEARTPPELGLRGIALSVLCGPSSNSLSQSDSNANADAAFAAEAVIDISPT